VNPLNSCKPKLIKAQNLSKLKICRIKTYQSSKLIQAQNLPNQNLSKLETYQSSKFAESKAIKAQNLSKLKICRIKTYQSSKPLVLTTHTTYQSSNLPELDHAFKDLFESDNNQQRSN
jgi:predicted phage-related endonuclease